MNRIMRFFSSPKWIHTVAKKLSEISEDEIISSINKGLEEKSSPNPDVSIIIPAYNEEHNLLKTLYTLSLQKTQYTYEIICIDNNSKDRTPELLDKLSVVFKHQPIQGCGPTRQMGLEVSKGDVILLADADCLYPVKWIEVMVKGLKRKGVTCAFGRFSFIEEANYSRWKLTFYEFFREAIAEIRNFKRPYYNAYGMSMAFYSNDGKDVGFIMNNKRGEDGRMCFDLMQRGKAKMVRNDRSRVWTSPRALDRENANMGKLFFKKVKNELAKLKSYAKPHPPHDTKTSD